MRAHQSQRKGDMARSNPDRAPTRRALSCRRHTRQIRVR